MSKQLHNSVKDSVLDSIHKGKAKMRPKSYFVARATMLVFGIIILLAALVYIISFTLFMLHQNGMFFLPSFGFRGIGSFLLSIPWVLVLVGIIFILLLEVVLKRFTLVYRRPLLYSVLIVVIFVMLAGFVVAQTPFHKGALQRADEGRLPLAGQLYKGFAQMQAHNMTIGRVTAITEDGFIIRSRNGSEMHVIINTQTKLPFGNDIQKDDTVMIMGEHIEKTIRAFGIRKITEDFDPLTNRSLRMHRQFR